MKKSLYIAAIALAALVSVSVVPPQKSADAQQPPANQTERWHSERLCARLGGIAEYRLKDGSRIDCALISSAIRLSEIMEANRITDRYLHTVAIEVEWTTKPYQALGQAQYYAQALADELDETAGIGGVEAAVIFLRKPNDLRHLARFQIAARGKNILVICYSPQKKFHPCPAKA